MANLFEIAAREKYRFPYKGQITVEDLWDLSPTALDSIYKVLNKAMKAQEDESLMAERAKDTTTENMVLIVKYIFAVKKEEANARKAAAENAEKRRHIMDILARKHEEALNNKSEEELLKMLDEL